MKNELKVDGITKIIKDKTILDNVSFSASSGDIIGLIGENGAGKTTLLKVICHIVIQNSGNIFYNEIDSANDYDKILNVCGAVFSDGMLSENNSGLENVFAYAKGENKKVYADTKGKSKKTFVDANGESSKNSSSDEIVNLCEKFKVNDYIKKRCGSYSLGMKQKTALLSAFAKEPEILILDEPLNGLDLNGKKVLLEAVKERAEKGAIVIISSHSLHDVLKVCNRFIVMDSGKIIANDKTDVLEKYDDIDEYFISVLGEYD